MLDILFIHDLLSMHVFKKINKEVLIFIYSIIARFKAKICTATKIQKAKKIVQFFLINFYYIKKKHQSYIN